MKKAKEKEKQENKTKKKKGIRLGKVFIPKYLIDFLIKIVTITLIFYLALTYVFGIFLMSGNYMFPAIRDGDLAITYKLESPISNECIVYEHDGKAYFGRLIARAGDVIDITENGELLLNGNRPSEQVFYTTHQEPTSGIVFPYTVPENGVFVLNDFRDETYDSRVIGAISEDDIRGRIIFVIRRRGF